MGKHDQISAGRRKLIFAIASKKYPELDHDELLEKVRELTPAGSVSMMTNAQAGGVIRKLRTKSNKPDRVIS